MATQARGWLIRPIEVPTERTRFELANHIPELDGLRGFAAIWVILHHIALEFPLPWHGPLRHWTALCHAGWMGVDLFFALSGFLITRILAATRFRPHYYRNFYMRRVLRLVPVYLLTLVLVAVFIPHSGTFLLLSLIYLANFSKWLHVPMAYGPLWSLAVEEHFYFIWPWLVRFLNRRTLACIGLVIVLGSPALRYAAELNGWYNPYVSWFRFDGLAWGALLALVVTSPAITRTRLVGFSVVIGALGSGIFGMLALTGHAARENRVGMALIFGLVSMMATSVIGLASARSFLVLLAPLRHPWLRFFGDISYWAYLFQELMVIFGTWILHRWLPNVWAAHSLGAWVLLIAFIFPPTVLTGILVRKWIELPVLSLKKNFR